MLHHNRWKWMSRRTDKDVQTRFDAIALPHRTEAQIAGRAGTAAKVRRIALATWSAGMSRMHRWWPRRHTGLWHGRQGRALATSMTAAIGLSGAQRQGLVGPKSPTAGVPSAAATWRRPESFETAASAAARARIALRRSGPVRSRMSPRPGGAISAAKSFSPGPPITHIRLPSPARRWARSAEWALG